MNDEQKQYTQRADINLRLFDGNPEQWTIAHDKVREAGDKGILLSLNDVLEADNNEELIPVRAEGLHPNLQKVLAENPDRVPTYRDQLQPLSNFAASAEWASLDAESRMKLLQKEYLEKHPAPAGVKRTPAVSYLDTCGAEERAILEKMEETIRSKISVDPSSLEGYLQLTPEGQNTAVSMALTHQKKINGVLTALQKDVPDWRNMNAASLAEQIDALRLRYGMDVEGVTPELLREGGVADVDYLQAVNVLGAVDIARAVMAKSPEELAAIDENSSTEDQLALLAHLQRQSQDLRGYSVWGDVVNIAVQSTPFVAEFMLTGGLATVGKVPLRVAVTQALKAGGVEGAKGIATALFRQEGRQALGNAVRAIAVGEAKRSPVMLPKNVAQAWNEYNDGPVVVHGEDGMKPVVPEKRVDEMFTLIARNVVRDYFARTSEWSGEFLPDLNLLSRAIPAGVKNRVVQAFLKGAEADPVKGAMFRRSLFSDVPLSGDIVEFAEEKVNEFMEYISTQTSHITGAEFLNMGEEDPVGSWRENLTTFLGVALQANAMRAVRTASAVRTVRDLAQLVDDQRSMVDRAEQVPLEQRSVVQSKEYYDRVRGGDRTFYVDTEDARTFFQSDPEFAEACGFTEEAIDRAEERGVMIGVSQNRMIAEQAKSPAMREAGERLLAVVRSSGITINQALSSDVGETVVKAYQEQQERLARYRDKFLSIFEGMEKSGVSKSAIRANSEIVSRMLNHLAVGIKEEGKIEEALDALLAEVSRDPEGFAASRPLYLTEVTEEMVQALEEAANAPIVEEAPTQDTTQAGDASAAEDIFSGEDTPKTRRKGKTPAVKMAVEEYPARYDRSPVQVLDEIKGMTIKDYTSLVEAWVAAGNREWEDRTVTLLMRLVNAGVSKYAKAFSSAGADRGKLAEIAVDQLQKVLADYDPAKGASFITLYSRHYLRNAVYTYLRSLGRDAGRVSSLDEKVGDDGAERQDFIADTGAEAPYAELEAADISEGAKSAVREIIEVLNAPPRTASGERAKAIVSARKALLRGLLEDKTQQSIAESLGVTKQAVGQQLSRIREKVIAIAEKHEAPLIDVLRALKELLQNEPNQFEQRGGALYQAEFADPEIRNAIPKYTGEQAKEVLKSLAGKPLKNLESGMDALINSTQSNKLISNKAVNKSKANGFTRYDHMTAVANIKALFGNASLLVSHPDQKNHNPAVVIHRFAAPAVIGGEVAEVLFTVKESLDKDSRRVYSLELTEIKKLSEKGDSSIETDYHADSIDNIRRKHDKVKQFIEKNPGNLFQDGTVIRGATSFGDYFDQNYRAIITLFEGNANASTLVHESAHWLKELMRSLCEMKGADGEYIADNALREEYNSIEKWLDKQKYESVPGTPEYTIEREEKFARAFEYYIMEGRLPAAEVASAFGTLKDYLRKIYQNLKNMPEFFGFEFSDDIRQVFDSLLTTETILERESPLREAADILRETFAGLLGLNQKETDDIRRLIRLADTQMAAEIDKHKAKLLPKYRKLWKKEAEDAMQEMRVYQAWQDVTKKEKSDGRMDTAFLKEEGIPEETIEALRAMGIAVRGGANPMDTVAKHKYGSLQEMVQDFMENRTPKEFTKDFMAEKEKAFMQNMELDEKTLSVSAVRDLLDKLTEILAVKGGKEGYAIRKGAEQEAALKEIGGTAVRDVAGDKLHLKSLKEHTANLTNAISKKDFLAALEHVEKIRKCMAVLKEKADAKKRITKTREKLMRAVRAPKGAIYADYHEALKELAYYFGYTKRQPEPVKPMEPNYRTRVMEAELNEELSDGYHWPPFLLSDEMRKTDDMVYADFELLADTVDHLYGKGRALVAEAKGSFGEKAKSRRAAIVEELSTLPAKFHRRRETAKDYVWSAGRSLLHIGENLRVLLGRADGYRHMETGEAGPCLMLRDEILAPAVSDAVRLEVETFRKIKAPLEALWAAKDRISLPPSQFRFIGKGLTYGYSKWTPEMVIAACLNMGNSVNRDRLVRGFGWQELDLNDLAACVPADLWEHIQAVWDGISGDLQKATAATFLKENYYNMRLVPAEGMTVRYPDGSVHTFKGGYYPIRYAHRAKSEGDAIPSGHSRGLYAEVSSTMMRVQSIAEPDPLDLGLNGIVKHVHETAWYAATRMACREVMAAFRSEEVEYAFGTTQSFEAYDMALNLIRNIANPDALTEGSSGDGGFMDMFERWSKTVMTSGALMMNLSSILKQPASITVGAQETGDYFLEAMNEFSRNPAALIARVKELSPMMSERINYMDPDLRDSALKFGKSEAEKVQGTMMRIGYAAMRFMDGGVAVPVWYAKYLQSMAKHTASGEMDLEEAGRRAVADAEDFVARTQGAGRTLDLTPIQLVRIGRLFSPFLTAANAQFNTQIETLGAVRRGRITGGQALLAIMTSIIAPAVYSAAVTALLNGWLSDDDDDMDKALKMGLQELIVSPVSGYPLVRDAAQYMAGTVTDTVMGGKKGYRPEVFEVSAFDAVSKVVGGVIDASDAALEGNWSRAAWKAADSIGSAAKVPAIRIYERATKQYKRTFGELPDVLERLEESTKKRKGKK